MNKQVILFRDAETGDTPELLKSLNEAGISVLFYESTTPADVPALESGRPLLAVVYQVSSDVDGDALRSVVEQADALWPGIPVLACPQQLSGPGHVLLDSQGLRRIGFRAVADSAPQLPALLREVEEVVGTGELRLPEGFKATRDSRSYALPTSLRRQNLHGVFALLSSLHLAANQKEAGLAVVAGIARLVPADHWSVRLVISNRNTDRPRFEQLVGRSFSNSEALQFDQDWQRELMDDAETLPEPESKAVVEAATKVGPIRKIERRKRVVALPLVSGDRVIGVLEGIRIRAGAKSFSRPEVALLSSLTLPIAAALANSVRIAEAERLSLTDELTRLHNARYLRQFLVNETKRARRYQSKLAALFLDLDDFKRVNDLYGHLAGSHALTEVAAVLLSSVRDTDCVVRYGGDEFVIVLPETAAEEAARVAERIRAKIERHQFTGGRRLKIQLTVSIGIGVFPQHALSPQQLIAGADRAMYEAKAAHKNCVRVATELATLADPTEPDDAGAIQPTQFQRIPDEKPIS